MTPQSRRPSISELAAAQVDVDDVRILDRVAAMYETLDPVPTSLIERIQFGITLDALHAEIAQLQRSNDLEGVRSEEPTQAQTVTFASASLTTMVTITPTLADRARIARMGCPGQRRGGRTALVGGPSMLSRMRTAASSSTMSLVDLASSCCATRRYRTASVITPSIEL